MCLYPKLILNRKYLANKKNGGNIPPVLDERVKYVPVGCEQCIECRKQKARSWQARLMEEIKENKNGKFVTLTFNSQSLKYLDSKIDKELEGYERDNEIATKAVRLFLERWRKKHKKSVRHWLVTELGHKGTEHIHIHGIIWTDDPNEIENTWNYGYVWKGYTIKGKLTNYVNERTVNYIIKYINKTDLHHYRYKSKILTSPGIGSNYLKNYNSKLNKYNGTKTKETYTTRTGHTLNLPIYWRNKIYTETEREKLWLQKLDKCERWICGEKIDSRDEETYYNVLKFHRRRNQQLKYGDDTKNWSRINYERQRREIIRKERIRHATFLEQL